MIPDPGLFALQLYLKKQKEEKLIQTITKREEDEGGKHTRTQHTPSIRYPSLIIVLLLSSFPIPATVFGFVFWFVAHLSRHHRNSPPPTSLHPPASSSFSSSSSCSFVFDGCRCFPSAPTCMLPLNTRRSRLLLPPTIIS